MKRFKGIIVSLFLTAITEIVRFWTSVQKDIRSKKSNVKYMS